MQSSGPMMTQGDFEPDEGKVREYLANIEEGDRAAILELLPPTERAPAPEPVVVETPVTLSQEIYVPPDIDTEGEVFKSFAPELQEQIRETLRKRKRQEEVEEQRTRKFLQDTSPKAAAESPSPGKKRPKPPSPGKGKPRKRKLFQSDRNQARIGDVFRANTLMKRWDETANMSLRARIEIVKGNGEGRATSRAREVCGRREEKEVETEGQEGQEEIVEEEPYVDPLYLQFSFEDARDELGKWLDSFKDEDGEGEEEAGLIGRLLELYVENKRLDSIAPTLSYIRRNGREGWVAKWITTWLDAVDEAILARGMMRLDRELFFP